MISDLSPALYPVLRIFVDEFDEHLGFFRSNLDSLGDEQVKRSVQHRFHTIRGSSGFLQLGQVRQLSEQGEALCKKSADSALLKQQLQPLVEELARQFDALKKELAKLPE